jgi:hypothetical protein
MNLLLDSPLFDLLYANIKARANSSVPKPPSDPRQRPTTHRLNIVIFCGKNFLVDFILGNERFLVNFVPATTAKASTGGTEMGLTTGVANGSSSSRKDRTDFDVLAGGASSTARASRAPRADDTGDDDADDEEPPLNGAIITTALQGRASDERDTLLTQRLWINFFFTILAVVRLKR